MAIRPPATVVPPCAAWNPVTAAARRIRTFAPLSAVMVSKWDRNNATTETLPIPTVVLPLVRWISDFPAITPSPTFVRPPAATACWQVPKSATTVMRAQATVVPLRVPSRRDTVAILLLLRPALPSAVTASRREAKPAMMAIRTMEMVATRPVLPLKRAIAATRTSPIFVLLPAVTASWQVPKFVTTVMRVQATVVRHPAPSKRDIPAMPAVPVYALPRAATVTRRVARLVMTAIPPTETVATHPAPPWKLAMLAMKQPRTSALLSAAMASYMAQRCVTTVTLLQVMDVMRRVLQ